MEQQNKFPNQVPIAAQEYLLLFIVFLITSIIFSQIWQKWGNWTLVFMISIPFILMVQFGSVALHCFHDTKPETQSQTPKEKILLWVHIIITTGLIGWQFYNWYEYIAWSDIWLTITAMVCMVIMHVFPSPKDDTLKACIRREVRILEVSLGVVLAATGIVFAVIQPISIQQGEQLASETVEERVTYITSLTAKNTGFYRYNQFGNNMEPETGCYLYMTSESGKEVIVYFPTGRVVVPSEEGDSYD